MTDQKQIDLPEFSYKITALGFNLSKKNKELINSLVQYIFKTEPKTIDLISNYFEPTKEDLLVIFGKPANNLLKPLKILSNQILLADPDQLDSEEGDEEERNNACKKLLLAKESVDRSKKEPYRRTLTKESLPQITANEVSAIERLNPNGWIGRTENGKTIRLSSGKIKGNSEDICMTYAELYALKVAVELLGIKEFELVSSTETYNERDSLPSNS